MGDTFRIDSRCSSPSQVTRSLSVNHSVNQSSQSGLQQSPLLDRLKTDYALYPITNDEIATCSAMLNQEPSSKILLMPTHHIAHLGDMMGFRYECTADRTGDALPIVRNMFFGHTATECLDNDADILKLMSSPEENRQKMTEFMNMLRESHRPADLDCIPDNATALTNTGILQATDLRSVDCKAWVPELPESIGLYHAYARGYNRDVRTHKLYIVCSGGCIKAADQFFNLVIDVGSEWTAGEIADSEEAWWLRKACQRSRCRLIKMLADHFKIRVPFVEDILAHPDTPRMPQSNLSNNILQAVPGTDTIEHDLSRRDNGLITVHNLAIDTTKITNGILCQMHPAEGVWLFKGAPRGTGVHGAMYGSQRECGAFPTRSPVIPGKHPNVVAVRDGSCIVRGDQIHQIHQTPPKGGYICFDETYFKNLERMQWNRDNGYVELIPIVVGLP